MVGMKKYLLLLFASLLACNVSAAEKIVFFTESYPPFQSMNERGELVGCSIDILAALQKHIDFVIDIQMIPWGRAYRDAKHQPNTFIFTIGKTKNRMNYFIWVDDLYWVQDALYKKKGRNDITITSIADASRYSIAIPRADVALERLNLNSDSENVYFVSDQTRALQMLNYDRVDLHYNNTIGFKEEVKLSGFTEDNFEIAYTVNNMQLGIATHLQTDPKLIHQLRQAMIDIRNSGELDIINNNCF